MSSSNDRLKQIASLLKDGKKPQGEVVRNFLNWFGAQRRGYVVVIYIRSQLKRHGLITIPDFESAYIDSTIEFAFAPKAAQTQNQKSTDITSDDGKKSSIVAQPPIDPTFRIGKLASANRKPISVKPDDTLISAATLMLALDFSQLPVMTSDREVKGIISWRSVGSKLTIGTPGQVVREYMENHHEVSSESSLFNAIPQIVQHEYVLIRNQSKEITGIVTTADLSVQFNQLGEPFLLLGEAENHIRTLLTDKFNSEELRAAKNPLDDGRQIDDVSDLTFGEYIRLFENPKNWLKTGLKVDREIFVKQLEEIRRIRNDVMHFDPDGIPESDIQALRKFAQFMQNLQQLRS